MRRRPLGLAFFTRLPLNRDAVAFLVEIGARPAKTVRINVMLPQDVVLAIDRVATNRSRFLAEAAKAKLAAGA